MVKIALFIIFISIKSILSADGHIFVLHRFDDSRYPSTSISSEQLIADFDYIEKSGYTVVKLQDFAERLQRGETVPDKWVAFTIDDGYKSFYDNGLPIFKKFGYPFTVFLYTESIDKKYPDYMSWEQVREVGAINGVELGIHSHTHPHLTHLNPLSIMKDTQKSIDSFYSSLQKLPKYYAYPYGEYNRESREIIQAFGFKAVFNQTTGAVSLKSDLYNVNRIALLGKHNIANSLKIAHLQTEWIYPESYPENSLLDRVEVSIPKGIKKVHLYISGHGWRWINVGESGIIKHRFRKPLNLKLNRVRLFIKSPDNSWSGHIIVK